MNVINKHPYILIWFVGLIVFTLLEIPLWGIVLLSLVYSLAVMLLRFKQSAFWIGYFLHGMLHQPEKARPIYDFAYSHGGKAGPPMCAYALLLMESCQHDQALRVLRDVQRATDLSPAMRTLSRRDLALAYEKTGDVKTAIEIMEQLRQEYEYFRSDFYTTLAYFYIEAGDYDKAAEINELAQAEDRECGAVYDNQALIAYRKGDLTQAEALFQKALDLDEDMVSPRFHLGLIAEEKGDRETAAQYFRDVHNAHITGLNTITRESAEEKYRQYSI